MLVKDFVMETCISYGEAGELAGVTIWVLATGDRSFNQTMFQKLLVKIASVSAEISKEVADFGTDSSVFVADQRVQFDVDVCIMDGFIELLGDPCKLRNQT